MHAARGVLLLVAALLAAAAAVGPAAAALLAIDLGSESLKLSIVKPGRIPISIVINEMSKRKSPALVAFVDGDRLVGEEAAGVGARYPDRVFARAADLLGRPADDPALAAMLKASYRPYTLVPAANRTSAAAAALQLDSGEQYSAEEVVASLLEYAKQLAEAAADGAPITDCVLAVPASYTPQQRQALLDAAKLAGLSVMGLVHSHAAAALQYGIERDFTNRTETVVLYDLGAASLQAALVSYSAYTDAKGVSVSQLDVRDVIWREDLGGEQLELVLMEHFADEFNAQLNKASASGSDSGSPAPQDVRTAPRAMAKLRKQVSRTKQILSANSEAPMSVEELWQDRDFRSTITREKFEELAGDFFERAAAPLKELLRRNNLTSADIAAVELLGGSSRVPRLKQALSDALGGRALDMHLDADEAVVLGAGLFAANLSTTFRLRQFGMADKVPYSVAIQLEGEPAPKTLVPALKKMPTKRGVHLHNLTADSLAFILDFDNLPGAMPCCRRIFQLGSFNVSGIQTVIAKYNESGKVSIHTSVDQSGMFHVDRADAMVEVMEVVVEPPPPPPPAANTTTSGTAEGAAGSSTANTTDANAAAPAPEAAAGKGNATAAEGAAASATAAAGEAAPPKMRRKTVKVALNVTGGFTVPGMNRTEIEASRRVMRRLRAADLAKRETAKARNDLESYIISTREKVESGEDVAGVTTDEQREAFLAQLTEMEDWLYGEGEAVDTAEYRSQLRKLRDVGDAIFARAEEAAARPAAVKLASDFLELTRKALNSWPEVKPWLNASDIAALAAKVEDFASWLGGKQEEQGKLAAHQDPAFKTQEVTSWLGRVQKAFNQMNNKRKPRPPPPPPPAPKAEANATIPDGGAGTNGTDTGVDGAKAGAEGTDGKEEAQQPEEEEQQKQEGEQKADGQEGAGKNAGGDDAKEGQENQQEEEEEDLTAHDELR